MRLILALDVADDAKDALFGVNAAQGPVLCDPQLGQVVADKVRAHHSSRGLATSRGRRPRKKGLPAVRIRAAGDEHML